MKTNTSIVMKVIALSLVLVLFIAPACKKKPKDPAPTIPPSTTFVMDFSSFSKASDTIQSKSSTATFANWGHSFANAAIWNLIITVGLAVPVASFLEALKNEAEWDSRDEIWIWSYSFVAGGVSHTAKLKGIQDGEYIDWKMYISKAGSFTDFLWYEGKTHQQETSGYWVLNDKPTNPNNLLRIDWNKNADLTSDIKYMNIVPSGPENGGYITYGIVNGTYDAFYKIYNKGQNNLTEIEWNRTSKVGRVKDPKKFGNSDWHCWNNLLQDAPCN